MCPVQKKPRGWGGGEREKKKRKKKKKEMGQNKP